MAANNITQKCQLAARNFLRNQSLSFIVDPLVQIRSATMPDDIQLAMVGCQANRATTSVDFEGNWLAILRVELRTNADDDDSEGSLHFAAAGELFSKFMTDTIGDGPHGEPGDLTVSLKDFTAQFVVPKEQGWDFNDRSWVSYLQLEVNCCGSDFPIPIA